MSAYASSRWCAEDVSAAGAASETGGSISAVELEVPTGPVDVRQEPQDGEASEQGHRQEHDDRRLRSSPGVFAAITRHNLTSLSGPLPDLTTRALRAS